MLGASALIETTLHNSVIVYFPNPPPTKHPPQPFQINHWNISLHYKTASQRLILFVKLIYFCVWCYLTVSPKSPLNVSGSVIIFGPSWEGQEYEGEEGK